MVFEKFIIDYGSANTADHPLLARRCVAKLGKEEAQMVKTCGRNPLKLKARGLENRSKSNPKSCQNAYLEASGRALGAKV